MTTGISTGAKSSSSTILLIRYGSFLTKESTILGISTKFAGKICWAKMSNGTKRRQKEKEGRSRLQAMTTSLWLTTCQASTPFLLKNSKDAKTRKVSGLWNLYRCFYLDRPKSGKGYLLVQSHRRYKLVVGHVQPTWSIHCSALYSQPFTYRA